MAISRIFVISSVFVLFILNASSYRILGIFPHTVKSHFIFTSAVMKTLAEKGHEVVVMSPFPQSKSIKNYVDISLANATEQIVNSVPIDLVTGKTILPTAAALYIMGIKSCEDTLSYSVTQDFLKRNEKFDLIMVESFNTDCYLGMAYKLKAPVITISTSYMMPWAADLMMIPDNPSYIPSHFLSHSDRMTFLERIHNTISVLTMKLYYKLIIDTHSNYIVRKYLGDDVPPVQDLATKVSLMFVNTHFALNQPRPLPPNIIEVGGLHLQKPKEVPKEFQSYLDGSKHGVIYFSFGSTVRSDTFTDELRNAFAQAFAELPHDVLWKWESESFPGKPKNVKIAKWMPQMEILSHRNVKAFITHGGLMGTLEGLYFGVPMIIIPLFGDQHLNAAAYKEEGMAVKLNYYSLSKDTILDALKKVLYNSSYTENAKRVSQAYMDRPLSPADSVVYWTEYVIRHRGAPQLQSAAKDLYWFQYLLLDVALVIISVISVIIYLAFVLIRTVFRCIFRRNSPPNPQKKKEQKKKKNQ